MKYLTIQFQFCLLSEIKCIEASASSSGVVGGQNKIELHCRFVEMSNTLCSLLLCTVILTIQ